MMPLRVEAVLPLVAFLAIVLSFPLLGAEAPRLAVTPATPPSGTEVLEDVRLDVRVYAEQIIREVYEKLARYAAADGSDLSFRIDDVNTYFPAGFDKLAWADLVTVPEGLLIDMERQESTGSLNGLESRSTVAFHPRWRLENRSFGAQLAAGDRSGLTVRQVLERAAEEEPNLLEVRAITGYQVTVALAGQQRTYRAAFLWQSPTSSEDTLFLPVDLVTQGVDRAAIEELPTAAQGLAQGDSAELRSTSAAAVGVSCSSWSDSYYFSSSLSGTEGHLSGVHRGSVGFLIDCSCSGSCVSACRARVSSPPTCVDSGIRDVCHVMAVSTGLGDEVQDDGHLHGASCAAGFMCGMKSCLFCLCGATAGVTVNGASVNFSNPGSNTWTFTYDGARRTCARCQEVTPPGPDTDPLPENEGGTPVIIDLEGRGFRFTDIAGGVPFDIDADGMTEQTSWTASTSRNAFLTLDRNANGVVDDGGELFGGSTPQPPSADPNGYRALAVFDDPSQGGDGDGLITAGDSVFAQLRLWIDRNHDGVSQPDELQSLEEAEVVFLDLRYRESRRRDRYGNNLRYLSRCLLTQGRLRRTTDVIFRYTE